MSAALSQARESSPQLEPARVNGMTPLMQAVCDDAVDVVRALLDSDADVNAKRSDGFTALALAAFFGRTRIVELLLEKGADVRAVTRFGTSPEMWAKARGFCEIVELLQDVPRTPVSREDNTALASPQFKTPRTLPEIHDPPAVIAPAFHPGHAFLTRISSDRRSLAALAIALVVTSGLAIFATYKIRSRLTADATQTASSGNSVIADPQAAVAQPYEPQSAPQESSSNQAVTVDLPNKVASRSTAENASPATMVKPSLKTISTPRLSHSSVATEKQNTVTSSEQSKQAAEPETESKPAPLTVEVSRGRNSSADSSSAPATHTPDPPPPQSAPLGITSSKPRTKVIQWP